MTKVTCAVFNHAASEDAIKDAVEDIALLQKEMDEAAYEKRKIREALTELPPLPVLGPEGHTVPPFALLDEDSLEFSHRNLSRAKSELSISSSPDVPPSAPSCPAKWLDCKPVLNNED